MNQRVKDAINNLEITILEGSITFDGRVLKGKEVLQLMDDVRAIREALKPQEVQEKKEKK